MSKEQIEEMADDIGEIQEAGWRFVDNSEYTTDVFNFELATHLMSKGYRKQSEGEWIDNHCTACGMSPIGDEAWTDIGLTPPKFEYCMSFCPCCGAKMKGSTE